MEDSLSDYNYHKMLYFIKPLIWAVEKSRKEIWEF